MLALTAAYIPLILLSICALWKENSVLLMCVSGLALMTGLYAPDIASGNYVTTPLGISSGLSLIMYSFACTGWALKLIWSA